MVPFSFFFILLSCFPMYWRISSALHQLHPLLPTHAYPNLLVGNRRISLSLCRVHLVRPSSNSSSLLPLTISSSALSLMCSYSSPLPQFISFLLDSPTFSMFSLLCHMMLINLMLSWTCVCQDAWKQTEERKESPNLWLIRILNGFRLHKFKWKR